MDSALITALLTFLTAIVPVLGTLLGLLINHKVKDSKDRALALALVESVTGAVKATAQTITASQRDGKGNLSAILATAAKAEALDGAKIILGSEKMAEAKAKYGMNGEVDKVLITLLEAALHDVKATKVTTSITKSSAQVNPAGKVETVAATTTTTATEPQPQPPPQPAPVVALVSQ